MIAPPELIAAATARSGNEEAFTDVWDDLRYDSGVVVCFTSSPLTPGDAFYLGFENSLAGNLIRLQVEASIEGIGVDPDRPPLAWEVWDGESWIRCMCTATRRRAHRDGALSIIVPLTHDPLTLGGTRAYWIRARLTLPSAGQPAYQASPQIRKLRADSLGGTIAASTRSTVGTETVGRSDGQPGQSFTVDRPTGVASPRRRSVRVITSDGVEEWIEVEDFTASHADDKHFTWDGATGMVRFGPRVRYPDGTLRQHGAIPRDGSEIVVTGYRHGGGALGNVGAGTLTVLRTTIPFIDRVSNLGRRPLGSTPKPSRTPNCADR